MSQTNLQRMDNDERQAFVGFGDLPSGPPMIGYAKFKSGQQPTKLYNDQSGFPVAVGTDCEGNIVVSCVLLWEDDDEIPVPTEHVWRFTNEADAIEFGDFLCCGCLTFDILTSLKADVL